MPNAHLDRVGGRYALIELLGKGGMGVVYRATDHLTGQTVALKRVLTDSAHLDFNTRSTDVDAIIALAQEFRSLASLRHPHIISVLDYGFDADRQAYFTMELLDNAQDLLTAARPETAAELLMQLLQALVYLHRRGIIHRDLKPGNVLVSGGILKVLDFGLSLRRDQRSPTENAISGTLAYIAPEIFNGSPASVASDLYAAGVMAYQIYAGKHPFQSSSGTTLLNNVLYTPPDISMIDPGLAGIVARLLAKDPADRYSDAAAALNAFQEFSGQVITESAATRESFLQAAQLVGRDAELALLSAAIDEVGQSHGSAWLIGGESGIGKSRLLDEVRILALVEGSVVLRGQAISEGGGPFQLWLGVLRLLSVVADISAEEASILRAVVPDIGTLLALPVEPAPALDAEAAQERLLTTIEAIFARQQRPILILLEDLHWANDSLDLLRRLCRLSQSQKLLIIASYRDDERRELPELVPELRLLTLRRFSQLAVEALIESVLGEARSESTLAAWLQRETEGNAFFLVETLRALAEESGQLANIGHMALPENVMTGGVRRIVQRRVERVPAADRALLDLAALAGRRLNPDVLSPLAAGQGIADLNNWLYTCTNVGVLEFQAGEWQFAHDKLREYVLSTIDDAARPAYHHQIGLALEASLSTQPDPLAPSDALLTDLAYHFYEAHDWALALPYATRAGERAQALYTPHLAVEHFSRAIHAAEALSRTPSLSTYRARGLSNETLGHFDRARTDYEFVLNRARMAADRRVELQALLDVGQLWAGRDYTKTGDYFREALELARQLDDPITLAQSLNRLGNWYVNIEQAPEGIKLHHEAAKIFEGLDDKVGMSSTYDLLGMANGLSGNVQQSQFYLDRAITLFREAGDLPSLASSLTTSSLRSNTYQLQTVGPMIASLQAATQDAIEALAITREIGQRSAEAFSLWQLGCCLGPQGEYDTAFDLVRQSIAIAEQIDHRQWLAAAHFVLGALWLDILNYSTAEVILQKALVFAEEAGTILFTRIIRGYLAATYLAQGKLAEAEAVLMTSPDPGAAPYGIGQRMIWYERAALSLARGETEAALQRLDILAQPAIRLEMLRGEILLAQGDADKAIDVLRAARVSAQDAYALVWRIDLALYRTYQELGEKAEADTALQAARQLVTALADNIADVAARTQFLQAFARLTG